MSPNIESKILTAIPADYKPTSTEGWAEYLEAESPINEIEILRRNIEKGLPCGGEAFIKNLEKLTNRSLSFKPIGRPKRVASP